MKITEKMLQNKVDHLNKLTGNHVVTWTRMDGKTNANIGNYHLYYAYGGVNLHQVVNQGGGVDCPLGDGTRPKRELYYQLDSFIKGFNVGKYHG